MTHDERLAAIRASMAEHKVDTLVAIHDGAHFIETPNPVFVLTRFKSLGPAAVVLRKGGETSLIVTPAWDAERARECCPGLTVVPADDVVEALTTSFGNDSGAIGIAGLPFTRWEITSRVRQALPRASTADD